MSESIFLKAFQGTNETVPVWFMRQAGRYLPGYRKIKEKHTLHEMFTQPDLAAEVTCLPISLLNVDAAILFADILTLPSSMGFSIYFDSVHGPVIKNPIKNMDDFKKLHDGEGLEYVAETIRQVKSKLNKKVPLIGFAGSPFSVLAYLIEGESSINFAKTLHFMYEQAELFHQMMEILTRNTIQYLRMQKKAGIDAYQLFDTWAGILRPTDYANLVLPYVKRIFEEIELPSIYFVKNTHHLLALMDKVPADFLSVDHTVVLGHHLTLTHTKKGIQGNLFNGLLYADSAILKKEINDVLTGGTKHNHYIFNLSHGVFPDIKVETLQLIVDSVHRFPWKKQKRKS